MSASNWKLTTNSSESHVQGLLGNDSVFEIPFFQRPYKWQEKRLKALNIDILNLVDESSDVHFLGAVILYARQTDPSDPDVYEVIDGQQRLTTIFLHLCAAIKTLIENEEFEEAERLFKRYLVTSTRLGGRSNLTLQPSKEDRADLNNVLHQILDTKDFRSRLQGFTFYPLSGSVPAHGRIEKNFASLLKFYKDQVKEGGVQRARDIYTAVIQRLTVVQIVVKDPTSGPNIFDSLNSQQEPMTIGDLVRNDVFNRVAREDPEKASNLDEHYWQPFYNKFKDEGNKSHFDSYFFPFGLIQNQNMRKSDAYTELKKIWSGKTPIEIIDDLKTYQSEFLDLVRGTNECKHVDQVAKRFLRIYRLGAPTSTYPFLMRLSRSVSTEDTDVESTVSSLDVIDSFLTRRALCGYEPTGLHAVFKRLWTDCDGEVSGTSVAGALAQHKTVVWPGDEELIEKIQSRPLYGTSIANYVITEYDKSLEGDPATIITQIEHVLPRSQGAGWKQFTSQEHTMMKDLFANLLPLSNTMNVELSNKPYETKRNIYSQDSVFKSTRSFATEFETWTPEALRRRGQSLGEWCVERWKRA